MTEVLSEIFSEIGELATEVNISHGSSYKTPDEGPVPEAVDAIIGLIYLIKRISPQITEDQLTDIATAKCSKWLAAEIPTWIRPGC